jgi:hypothetical protein
MSPAAEGEESQHLQAPMPSTLPPLSALSIDEEYFAQRHLPATPQSPRPASTDLPASLALPLSRARSSTSPASPPSLRAAPSVSLDDDNASIRSFVPTVNTTGDDLEAMLSEMLGAEARWKIDDDLDIWEGQSEGDSDTDFDDESEPEDDGTAPPIVCLKVLAGVLTWDLRGRGEDDSMAGETETFLYTVGGREADLFAVWR